MFLKLPVANSNALAPSRPFPLKIYNEYTKHIECVKNYVTLHFYGDSFIQNCSNKMCCQINGKAWANRYGCMWIAKIQETCKNMLGSF